MKQENQNELRTIDFIEVNGIGTVTLADGSYRDVFVFGYFIWHRWAFIIHRDVETPHLLTVSEASTGRKLKDETYYSVEDAIHFALPFIERKRYYFATTVGDILVKTQCNLLNRNTSGLCTLAIETLWIS